MEKDIYVIRLGVIIKFLKDNKETIAYKFNNDRLNKEIEMAIKDLNRIYAVTKFCKDTSVVFYSEITEEEYSFEVPNGDEKIPFSKKYIISTDCSKIEIQYRKLDLKTGLKNEEYYDEFVYEEGKTYTKKQRR